MIALHGQRGKKAPRTRLTLGRFDLLVVPPRPSIVRLPTCTRRARASAAGATSTNRPDGSGAAPHDITSDLLVCAGAGDHRPRRSTP